MRRLRDDDVITLVSESQCIARIVDDQLAKAVDVLSDITQHSLFNPNEIDKERKVIIEEFDNLLETSFTGSEAEKVKSMVSKVALKEHEADLSQRQLLKNIFSNEEQFSHGEFQLWLSVMREIKTLSNTSEKLAHRIRNLLDLE